MNRKKKVLLIWPATEKTFYDFHPLTTVLGGKGQFVPLPLLTVAGALGDSWDYQIIDEEVDVFDGNCLSNADFVFISINILQWNSAKKAINIAKRYNLPVIVGGPLVTTLSGLIPDDIAKVIGEIESPLDTSSEQTQSIASALSDDMKSGKLKKIYKGNQHPDIKNIAAPRYDILNIKNYVNLSLQTSRGCHHNCSFCQIPCLYGFHQRKTPGQIDIELSLLYKYGGGDRTVFIIDDNFIGNIDQRSGKNELRESIDVIATWQEKHNYPYDFFVQCSLEIADHDDILKKMVHCGINMMFVGIESLDPMTLKTYNKHHNISHEQCFPISNTSNDSFIDYQVAKVRKLQEIGMGVFAGLMSGFDEDNKSSIDNQIKFMRLANIPIAGITILQAPNGTPLFRKMEKTRRISSDPLALTKTFSTNIILNRNPEQFFPEFYRLIEAIYGAKEYFRRCISWVSGWNNAYLIPGRKGSLPANFRILRLLRSIWQQGIISSYRANYWVYIFKAVHQFRRDPNRLGICLFLCYFYQAIAENLKATKKFVKHFKQKA
jgi:radical SAM superfamily enzyme YgiQ (UPF0313 family)